MPQPEPVPQLRLDPILVALGRALEMKPLRTEAETRLRPQEAGVGMDQPAIMVGVPIHVILDEHVHDGDDVPEPGDMALQQE